MWRKPLLFVQLGVCLLWRHPRGKRVLKGTIHRRIPPRVLQRGPTGDRG